MKTGSNFIDIRFSMYADTEFKQVTKNHCNFKITTVYNMI